MRLGVASPSHNFRANCAPFSDQTIFLMFLFSVFVQGEENIVEGSKNAGNPLSKKDINFPCKK